MSLAPTWTVTVERIRPDDADAARSVLQGVVGSIRGETVDRVITEGGGVVPALSLEQANSLMTKLYELGIASHKVKVAEAPPLPPPPQLPTAFTPSRPDEAIGTTRGVFMSQWTLTAIGALLLLIAALGTTALVRSMRRDAAATRLERSKAEFAACMQHELDIALVNGSVGPFARLTAEIKCHPGNDEADQNRRDLETLGATWTRQSPAGQSKQAAAPAQIERRVAKAQADLRGLYSALVAFRAHCGDVPATTPAFTSMAPLVWAAPGPVTCVVALAGNLDQLGAQWTDANLVPAGPFYRSGETFVPLPGWTYTYTRTAPGQFTLNGLNAADLPAPGINFP